jgi:hypothetical protein
MNNDKNTSIGKIEDAGKVVRGGGIDRYWERENIQLYPKHFVGTNQILKEKWLHDSTEALNHFNLRSIEFGNWMSQEDRANFLYAAMLGLHQLAIMLNVKDSDIGFGGKLSIALGARGHGRAAGHYEAMPFSVINITKTKGIGVLAHEFAHALDNIVSFYTGGKQQSFVSGGRSTRKGYEEDIAKNGNYFEKQFEELFNVLFYNTNGEITQFHDALNRKDEYWNRRNEIFARTFEVYIADIQKREKITNKFLVLGEKGKAYPKIELVNQVAPMIAKIVKKGFQVMRSKGKNLKGLPVEVLGYKGFRKTLVENADLEDTLKNMQRIAIRDTYQVSALAEKLKGKSVKETSLRIWNWLRANTKYKLDKKGLEELRTPARSIIDGKAGLTNSSFGIDCDDYTILISAILLNLGIDHEYRITAYEERGQFQHIYPVAIDENGNQFVIDVVPEIPHFNYEAEPIKDIKVIKINAHSLSGYLPIDATINPNINPTIKGYNTKDMELQELSGIGDAEEFKNDLQNELNQPFNLSGIEDDLEEEILSEGFLKGLGEVATEEEADIVLSTREEAIQLLENGLLAEVHKAKNSLEAESKTPSELSKLVDVPKELDTMIEIIEAWDDEDEREATLKQAVASGSSYANFFKALLISLSEMESSGDLSGIDSEPIFLAKIEEDDISDILDDDDELFDVEESIDGFFRRRKGKRRRGGFFKRLFKKVGTGIKKAVKAVVRFNPVTIATRASILLVLKTNAFNTASSLIYGYLTQQQAEANGLDLTEWRKLVDAKNKGERFFTKMGGKATNFRKAIVKGKAAQKTGLRLGGLGASTQQASGFVNFIKGLVAKINISKLFKKRKRGNAPNQRSGGGGGTSPIPEMSIEDFGNNLPASSRSAAPSTTDDPNAPKPSIFKRVFTMDFWKNDVWAKHKKKIMIGAGFITILIPLAVYLIQKFKKKKKRQLSGVKAARTRARNRRNASKPKRSTTAKKSTPKKKRSTPRKRKSGAKKKVEQIGRGSTTVIKTPTKGQGKTRVSKMTSRDRMSLMHAIAQKLRKKHPKTKYSKLLSMASKQI